MNTATSPALRYSRGAIAFHWAIALLIAFNFAAAWIAEDLPKAEAALNGKAVDEALAVAVGEAAAAEVEPQDDIHASAPYRRALTGTLAERALKAAMVRQP